MTTQRPANRYRIPAPPKPELDGDFPPVVHQVPTLKECPACGEYMWYGPGGYHWDGTEAMRWRCSCWTVVWDGDRPWTRGLYRMGLFGAYIERYGGPPFETQKPPDDFCVQPRLF